MSDVRQGQRLHISATSWNSHERVAKAYERGELTRSQGVQTDRFDPTVIWIQNKTGGARAQFEVVKLGPPVILPSDNEVEFRQQICMEGIATTDGCRVAVLLEPAAVDAVVRAKIAGVVQTQLVLTTETPDLPLDVGAVAGEYNLNEENGDSGVTALWVAEPGDEEEDPRWAYIQLGGGGGGVKMKLGKTDGNIAKNGGGTVSVWTGSPETDSGENITVSNRIGAVTTGKWCICAYFNGKWYLVNAEC